MNEISNRSQPTSPSATPAAPILDDALPHSLEEISTELHGSSTHSSEEQLERSESKAYGHGEQKASAAADNSSVTASSETSASSTRLKTLAKTFTPSQQKQQSLGAAALAAKNWGWKTIAKPKLPPQHQKSSSEKLGTPDNPIGRGHPLPPPGQPLPPPDYKRSTSFQLPTRKAAPPRLPPRPKEEQNGSLSAREERNPPRSAPPPETDSNSLQTFQKKKEFDDMLVVAAPADSGPPTPAANDEDEYGDYMVNVQPSDADSPLKERGDEEEEQQQDREEGEVVNDSQQEATEDTRELEIKYEDTDALKQEQDTDGHEEPIQEPAEASKEVRSITVTKNTKENEREPKPAALETESTAREAHEDEDQALSPWKSAQEAEERSRGIWTEEPEIPIA